MIKVNLGVFQMTVAELKNLLANLDDKQALLSTVLIPNKKV